VTDRQLMLAYLDAHKRARQHAGARLMLVWIGEQLKRRGYEPTIAAVKARLA
jgi:hypothetical protein